MINTSADVQISESFLKKYFENLVNQFFKILPMREDGEESVFVFMRSLQVELLGCQGFIELLHNEASYLSLLFILQYLIDTPDCPIEEVKREVFKAISLCEKISSLCSNHVKSEAMAK